MKSFLTVFTCALVVLLSSCNTTIGLWRDGKEGVNWTKQKIQESQSGGGGHEEYDYGAPVY
jgi:predicted small secreted protein